MGFVIGMVIALGCILGGFAAMGGHLSVIWQPWEFVIIGGASLGTFIVANPMSTIKDTGRAMMEAILDRAPTQRHYLDVLGVLYTLMRELRGKGRNELEQHVDNPNESTIFKSFPRVLADKDLTHFICDYCRLIIIGNARTHEIEALMDEEIQTVTRDRLKSYHALTSVSDGLPALGIVAAVLGVIMRPRKFSVTSLERHLLAPLLEYLCPTPWCSQSLSRSNRPASRVAVSISL